MAKNTDQEYRVGAVKGRIQTQTHSGLYVERDTSTGKFINMKTSERTPFKGVRKEK
ncbi:MAG: hypothetical protein P0Y55_17775 [Candidatus Cohnella colombiensis]|uniref:Uncharacterized protein n=1 Tax=Candidatus Cohnella colombiensis TaxID=3121368 RepID=A0AA95EWF4_9BACL|nr:MAG: hypothetical protein P0Y55_17775 [Cohnella sp.]